jgi:hypothetical protein
MNVRVSQSRLQLCDRHHMGSRSSEYHESRMVNIGVRHRPEASIRIIVRRRRVREEHYAVVAEHRITRRGMAAILGRSIGEMNAVFPPEPIQDLCGREWWNTRFQASGLHRPVRAMGASKIVDAPIRVIGVIRGKPL